MLLFMALRQFRSHANPPPDHELAAQALRASDRALDPIRAMVGPYRPRCWCVLARNLGAPVINAAAAQVFQYRGILPSHVDDVLSDPHALDVCDGGNEFPSSTSRHDGFLRDISN